MSAITAIPFLDLVTLHSELKEEICAVLTSALRTAGFIGGPMAEAFEQDFAAACDTRYCVGVGSGTDAVRFILLAAGIQQGEIVLTAPNTFIATTEAISQAGGRPDFIDVCGDTYNLDPAKLEEYLECRCYVEQQSGHVINLKHRKRVSAILPVHLFGQTADMDAILAIAKRFRLPVFEDACQAHGARYYSAIEKRWLRAGSMGAAAAFSFYPGKNLGACGEAGAVTTNDPGLAEKIRMLRDHGQARKYHHEIEGYNGRLDAIQAGILQLKLRRLAKWNADRREAAELYRELLGPAGGSIVLPFEPVWSKAVYHLYVIAVQERDALQQHLAHRKIGTGVHYPIPLHLQKAYRRLGFTPGDFPVAERSAASILSLPMFPGLLPEQQRIVAREIRAFLAPEPVRVYAAAARSVGE